MSRAEVIKQIWLDGYQNQDVFTSAERWWDLILKLLSTFNIFFLSLPASCQKHTHPAQIKAFDCPISSTTHWDI